MATRTVRYTVMNLSLLSLSCLLGYVSSMVSVRASVEAFYKSYVQRVIVSPSARVRDGFHIGISLQPSYGSATVSFANGSTTHFSVPAAEDYVEVMTRLSLYSSRHLAPPYESPGDSFADSERVMQRRARKDQGLPASEDVGVLSQTVNNLRTRIESELAIKVTSAALSVPHIVALYQDDVQDMFEYLSLKYIKPTRYFKPLLWETAATYAGYGLGLCEAPEDATACDEEEQKMLEETVFLVHYDHNALLTSLSKMKTATGLWEPDNRHTESFQLGGRHKDGFEGGDDKYWERVQGQLQAIMVQNPYYPRPAKILLSGNIVRDEGFQRTLRQAMNEIMDTIPPIFEQDAECVASNGAAELARRAMIV